MSKKHVIKDLLSKIGLFDDSNEKSKTGPSTRKSSGTSEYLARSKELEAFEQRIDQVLERHSNVGGHLFMLDFSTIKAKLGSKWEKSSQGIHGKIKSTIKGHLSSHDVQFQKDDVTYMLLLPSLGVEEGQLKSSIIAEEVTKALVGADEISTLFKVQTVTTTADGELVSNDTPPITNLLERVSERLNSMPEKPSSSPSVHEQSSETKTALKDFHFVFRPLLSVKTKIISTFLCIPVYETASGHYVSGYEVLGFGASADEIFALDTACVDKVADELWNLSTSKKRSLLALPVHFETLADKSTRMAYVGHCREKFQDLTNRVIFEITGLPEGVPQIRILDFVSALKPVSRAVIARFASDHNEFAAYRSAGLHAVGIDIFDKGVSEAVLMKQMDKFVQNARQVQLKSYVEGVRSLSMFTATITSGFDYIAGYALSGVVGSADDIKEFKLDSVYLSMLKDMGRLPKS